VPKCGIQKGWKFLGFADVIYKFWRLQVHSRNLQFSKNVGCITKYAILDKNENGGIFTCDIK